MHPKAILLSVLLVVLSACGSPSAQPGASRNAGGSSAGQLCDQLAAHPADPQKPRSAAGVGNDQDINVASALQACAQAYNADPNQARFLFQYGRALYAKGLYDHAKSQFLLAQRMGHRFSGSYVTKALRANRVAQQQRRPQTARPRSKGPHDQFVRETQAVGRALLRLGAAGLAADAANPNQPAKPLPPGATREQCIAALQKRTLRCAPVAEYTETGALYTIKCNSIWKPENRACTPSFNGPDANPNARPYHCDPVTRTKKNTRNQVVAAVCRL